MTISLGNAFKSIKDDEHWVKKIAIGGVIYLLYLLASFGFGFMSGLLHENWIQFAGIPVYLLFSAYMMGFILVSANEALNNPDFKGFVEWSQKNLLVKGLKAVGAFILYSILAALIFVVLGFVFSLIVVIIGLIVYLILNAMHLDQQLITIFGIILITCASFVLGLYYAMFINTAFAAFLKTYKIADILAFKKHFNIIKNNQHACWTLIGKNILFTLLALLVFIILGVTIVGIVLIPFAYFVLMLIPYKLLTQFAQEIKIEQYL